MALPQADEKLKPSPKIVVLSGGGGLGIAEMGVCDALKRHQLADQIEIVAGSSIGSLIGLDLVFNFPIGTYLKKLLSKEVDLALFPDLPMPMATPYPLKGSDPHLVAHAKSFYNNGVLLYNSVQGAANLVQGYLKKGLLKGEYIESVVKKVTQEGLNTHKPLLLERIAAALKDEKVKLNILKDKQQSKPTATLNEIDAALSNLKSILEGNSSLTFGALHLIRLLAPELHFKDMTVAVTNTLTKPLTMEYLSYETAPDMPLEIAIHASMAVPGVYAPVQYNNKLYADGGTLDNTPYKPFTTNPRTKDMPLLAVDFGLPPHLVREEKLTLSTLKYAKQYSSVTFDAQKAQRTLEDHERILYLHHLKTSMLDFGLTREQQQDLYDKGYQQAEAFLEEKHYISAQKKLSSRPTLAGTG